MAESKYGLMSFNLENDRSAGATVTGMAMSSSNNLCSCGKAELMRLVSIISDISIKVFFVANSPLNSIENARVSIRVHQ